MKSLHWSPFLRLASALLYSFAGVLIASGNDAAPGDLDVSFDPGSAIADSVNALAIQSDGRWIDGGSFTQIESPANERPTSVSLSNAFILGDAPVGSTVGLFSVDDPDEEDTHVVMLDDPDGSSDNGFFAIDGNTLVTAALFDPGRQTYTVRVKASDQAGLWVRQTFTITAYSIPGEEPGNIDLSFGSGSPNGGVSAISRLPDGRWIVAGGFSEIGGHPQARIARLHADGSLDSTFANGLGDINGPINAVAIQPNGQMLIAGNFTTVHGVQRAGVARLHEDGSLDESFDAAVQMRGGPHAIAVQADGGVLVGGYLLTVNGVTVNGIARLHPDGNLDEIFASFSYPSSRVYAIQVLDNQKILLAGSYRAESGGGRTLMVRLHPDGALDETFVSLPTGHIRSFALQPDGRIVIGGNFSVVGDQPRSGIARLYPDGSLDTSFGHGMSGVEGSPRLVSAVAVQADGRIVIGGRFTTVNGETRNGIARLHADGSLDESFGAGLAGAYGFVEAVAASGLDVLVGGWFTLFNDFPRSHLVLLRGGNQEPADILLSHHSFRENQAIGSFVARITAVDPDQQRHHIFELVSGEGDDGNVAFTVDGNVLRTATLIDSDVRSSYSIRIRATDWGEAAIEKTFVLTVEPTPTDYPGPGGLDLSFTPPPMNGEVLTIAQQDDGKILIGGSFTSIGGTPLARIARLNADGTLDATFAEGLSGAVGPGFGDFFVQAIAVQPDGKILIGGAFDTVHGIARSQIARLHEDGSLDTGFQASANGAVKSIALQEDGRIVIGGSFTSVKGISRNYVARLLPDGTVDSSFGNGLVGPNSAIEAVGIDANGRILIGGWFTWVNGGARNRIARLNADGTLDPTFGDELAGADGTVYMITQQSDGKILIGGNFDSVHHVTRHGIARLHEDGTLDSDFAPEPLGNVRAIALQRDARILTGGLLLRLNPDGSRDVTFSRNPTHFVHSLALANDGNILAGTNTGIVRIHGGDLPPADLTLSRTSVAELQPPETTVGVLSVLDDPFLDASTEHEFILIPGEGNDGNEAFAIDGDHLKTADEFDAQEQDVYAIRIRAANAKGLWIKRTFIVSVLPDHYARWAADLPEGQRDPTADPGGYGIPNLLRYAFGMGALQPAHENLPQIGTASVTADGQPQTYLTLTYTRRTADSTLNPIAEVSNDLHSWFPFEGAEEILADGNGETETVTLTDSEPITGQTKRFLRVRVEREVVP